MENCSRMIELELIISQKDDELFVKDSALLVKNKEIEEKNNTIKRLTEKLQQFQSQYHDYKATCTKIIDDQRAENLELHMELCDKLKVKDDKIEELSTKLAEVVVGNINDGEVEYWKCRIDRKNDYINELNEQIEDLESIIDDQKEHFADLENGIEKLKDRLSPIGYHLPPDWNRATCHTKGCGWVGTVDDLK